MQRERRLLDHGKLERLERVILDKLGRHERQRLDHVRRLKLVQHVQLGQHGQWQLVRVRIGLVVGEQFLRVERRHSMIILEFKQLLDSIRTIIKIKCLTNPLWSSAE